MRTLAPKVKVVYTILIACIVLHTVLSFFDCVSITSKNYRQDFLPDESTRTQGLMAAFVLTTALIRIGLVLPNIKAFHYISGLISLFVSVATSGYIWVQRNLTRLMSGLFWKHYELTVLGIVVIALSWVITVLHAVALALACRGSGEQPEKRKNTGALWIAAIIGILLLIIFRDVIIDALKRLL